MRDRHCVFYSHRVESLYERLKESLFTRGQHPFARRLVVVPSPAMKSWLYLTMAQDPTCRIGAGLDVGYVDQTLRKLLLQVSPSPHKESSPVELSLLIEEILASANVQKNAMWEPVKQFLGDVFHTRKGQKRKTGFALELASLFVKYGLYGGETLRSWENNPQDWQEELWKLVWESASTSSYPVKLVEDALDKGDYQQLIDQHAEVHLFSISFLPALYHRFLVQLSRHIPVHYYVLSPCQAFWSDILSDRECRRLYAYWKDKGASETQLNELDDYMRDRNPLLANFGRLGREMAEQLEAGDGISIEDYILHEALKSIEPYASLAGPEIAWQDSGRAPALLDFVQADLALMRNPLEFGKLPVCSEERSIQLHISPNRRREVESLYDTIMKLLDRHKEDAHPLTPGDIIVMAPDLQNYEPYIKMVFGGKESLLDYQLMEVDLLSQSSFVQAFRQLTMLAFSRWDAASLLDLLELPAVKRKHRLTTEDVRRFREWIRAAGIRWGHDVRHCSELLTRDNCERSLADETHPGTWQEGMEKLLAGLAYTEATGESVQHFTPLEVVDANTGELLGRWMELLEALRNDLKPLHDGTMLTPAQWSDYLKALADAYLMADPSDADEMDSRLGLMRELDRFARAGIGLKGASFSFASVQIYLDRGLGAARVNYREGHLKAVRFCSLLPMRALPAQAVILLGMDDNAFPKTEKSNGLDLLKTIPEADYSPSPNDFDRSLFLEALLSARRYFIMSYTGYCEGKEVPSSVLVAELMAYLDTAYECAGKKPSLLCTTAHPLHAFDERCFTDASPYPGYSIKAYQAALACRHENRLPQHTFLPALHLADTDAESRDIHVDIKDLTKLARNSLELYFNKTLGIYIPETAHRSIEVDETFVLDNLALHRWKEQGLACEADEVLKKASKGGLLPGGLFKEMAVEKLRAGISELRSSLKSLKADLDPPLTIRLSAHCDSPERSEKEWVCPPLVIDLDEKTRFVITGTLKHATPAGLIVLKDNKFEDILQVWPQYLIFCSLIARDRIPAEPRLLCVKAAKIAPLEQVDVEESLKSYLYYYQRALEAASPLLPQWAKAVIEGNSRQLETVFDNNFGQGEERFYNSYAKWAFSSDDSRPDAEEIVTHWREEAEKAFGPLVKALSKKEKEENE